MRTSIRISALFSNIYINTCINICNFYILQNPSWCLWATTPVQHPGPASSGSWVLCHMDPGIKWRHLDPTGWGSHPQWPLLSSTVLGPSTCLSSSDSLPKHPVVPIFQKRKLTPQRTNLLRGQTKIRTWLLLSWLLIWAIFHLWFYLLNLVCGWELPFLWLLSLTWEYTACWRPSCPQSASVRISL